MSSDSPHDYDCRVAPGLILTDPQRARALDVLQRALKEGIDYPAVAWNFFYLGMDQLDSSARTVEVWFELPPLDRRPEAGSSLSEEEFENYLHPFRYSPHKARFRIVVEVTGTEGSSGQSVTIRSEVTVVLSDWCLDLLQRFARALEATISASFSVDPPDRLILAPLMLEIRRNEG